MTDALASLIPAVREAAASPENARRRGSTPALTVGMEDPIAWTRIFGYDANRLYTDPVFNLEQQLRQKLWRWEHIADDTPITPEVGVFLSWYPEYTFLGMEVTFSPEGIPRLDLDHPMRRTPDAGCLPVVDFRTSGWMPRILEWHERFRELTRGELTVTLPVWGRGCLDLAMQLRGYEALVTDAVERPAFLHELLGRITTERCRWFEGAYRYLGTAPSPAGIADDWLNVPYITPEFFATFVLPRYLEMERFHGGVAGIHSCGDQTPLQRSMLQLRSLHAFEVSPWTDLGGTLANIPADRTLVISVHPNAVLVAGAAEMETTLKRFVTACRGRHYNVGTSGLTPLDTDIPAFLARIAKWLETGRRLLAS